MNALRVLTYISLIAVVIIGMYQIGSKNDLFLCRYHANNWL